MMPILSLNNVVFTYPGAARSGVHLVNLEIEAGEYVGILGANGSGKSTLARLCCGLLLPASGEVRVDGLSTGEEENLKEIRQRVGLVFQHPDHQFVANTIASEIAFGLENLRVRPEEMRKRVEEAMVRFDLMSLAKIPPHRLSGGEKRRLSLAAVWVLRPKILLVDEPLAMLDSGAKKNVTALLKELRDAGTTLLWLGHSLEEVIDADRVQVLYNGGMVWEGKPRELLTCAKSAREWGVSLPAAYELAEELSADPPPLGKEEELVTWLWN